MEPVRGLIAPTFTPVTANGELDLPQIERMAADAVRDSLTGVFVAGTTGEGLSLSSEERRLLTAAWREIIDRDRLPLRLIVHAGHLSMKEAQNLAHHAETMKADAIAALAPCFFKPDGVAQVVEWCARIADAAPRTPFLFYHIPSLTGVSLKMAEFVPAAIERIPTFAGLKFTHTDFDDFGATVKAFGDQYSILSGPDEMLLSALRLGGVGAVGTTYNLAAPLYHRMIAAHQAGDAAAAEREQARAASFIQILRRHGVTRTAKAMMAMIGRDCGSVLPPLTPLSPEETSVRRDELETLGFFDWRQ